MQAIFASLDFGAQPLLPFEPGVAKIFKFMNPVLHRHDVKQLGSILDNDPMEHVEEVLYLDEEEHVAVNPLEWARNVGRAALYSVDSIRMGRHERKVLAKARKQREAEQFTTWFDAMENNQAKMQHVLGCEQMHFG